MSYFKIKTNLRYQIYQRLVELQNNLCIVQVYYVKPQNLTKNRFCCKNFLMWYNRNRKTTAHKVGCRLLYGLESHSATWQCVGVVFLCISYFLFWKMNVSNARINIPKIIRSWKVKYIIDITSILQRNEATTPCNTVVADILSYKQNFSKKYKPLAVRRGVLCRALSE